LRSAASIDHPFHLHGFFFQVVGKQTRVFAQAGCRNAVMRGYRHNEKVIRAAMHAD